MAKEASSPTKEKGSKSPVKKTADVPEQKKRDEPAATTSSGATKSNDPKKKKTEEPELSEEDQALKSTLEMLVQRLKESDTSLYKPTLESLRTMIRESTSSMTSVPKPLKFLRPHYPDIKSLYDQWKDPNVKGFLADVLSALAMTYAEEGQRESLKYRQLGTGEPIGTWGHEYVRHLAAEIIAEQAIRLETEKTVDDLMSIVDEIVPFCLSHNAEADACDLLLEIEKLDRLTQHVDANTYRRVCLYLLGCVPYVSTPDDIAILETVYAIYRKQEQITQAMNVAIRLNDREKMKDCVNSCQDEGLARQLGFMLARQQIKLDLASDRLDDIVNNSHLSEHFLSLGKELDVTEAKTPEDIYKTHLENNKFHFGGASIDSARANLASSFVNAFVNTGFGQDKLMLNEDEKQSWIYKNKEHGMMSATASLGLIMLWDVENGLTQIDKYLYSQDAYIKAGALMAIGIVNAGVRNDADPALAILSEQIESTESLQKIAAITGLGLAYAGSQREDVGELLMPILNDGSVSIEMLAATSLSLGLIFVGSVHGEIISASLQALMEREKSEFTKSAHSRFFALGLALLFLGKQEASEAALETLKVIEAPIVPQVQVLINMLAYAGTGNVLKVQEMLHVCNDHLDKEGDHDTHQAFAVLGIALIAMGENISLEMALRSFNHLMRYGEPVIRRAVPLAIGLLCASNPLVHVLDTLGKYSHDNDQECSMNACFALGLVGAGTNNARLAQMLRQLASYYYKEPGHLFVVRIAQGLLHMGKGTLSVKPYHSDRFLLSPVAIGGLLTSVLAMTDSANLILGKHHYLLYHMVLAMYPRFLVTFDEDLKPLPVLVRVGQAVDTVGQAGRPKTITGFQTHTTPVLLGHSERAELATEEYISLGANLEGLVILRKNPLWVDTEKAMEK